MTDEIERVKCVVVGDGAVGKTCMLWVYANNQFPEDHVPTVFDNYSASVRVDNRTIALGLWDTAGQEDYDRLRPLSYPGTDVFILCFSLVNRNSWINVREKWHPELMRHAPRANCILVGTKLDLKKDAKWVAEMRARDERVVTWDEGEEMKQTLQCVKYVECSAKTGEQLKYVFDTCIRVALFTHKKKKCIVL